MAGKAEKDQEETPQVKVWYTGTGVRVETAMDVEALGWTDAPPVKGEQPAEGDAPPVKGEQPAEGDAPTDQPKK